MVISRVLIYCDIGIPVPSAAIKNCTYGAVLRKTNSDDICTICSQECEKCVIDMIILAEKFTGDLCKKREIICSICARIEIENEDISQPMPLNFSPDDIINIVPKIRASYLDADIAFDIYDVYDRCATII